MQTIKNNLNIMIYKSLGGSLAVAEASTIHLQERPDGSKGDIFYFNRINVPFKERNKGIGAELLKALLNECKGHNIALLCEINPYGDLDYEQLKAWYKKYGFVEYEMELWYIPDI